MLSRRGTTVLRWRYDMSHLQSEGAGLKPQVGTQPQYKHWKERNGQVPG